MEGTQVREKHVAWELVGHADYTWCLLWEEKQWNKILGQREASFSERFCSFVKFSKGFFLNPHGGYVYWFEKERDIDVREKH